MARHGDKRDSERIEILGELKGDVTIHQAVAVREISRGGAQIEINVPLHVDSLHEFRLTLGHRSVVVKGRVVHCSITDVERELVLYKAGIEFVEPSEPVAAAINDFVEAIQTGRRAL
jgi:hypothetical protein